VRRAALLLLLAGTTLLACGDDGSDDDDAGDETTTTAAADPLLGDCTEAAETSAPAEALGAFPDNPDVTWTVLAAREGGLGTVLVELEPDPDEVGYPSFTFVFGCGSGEPVRLATYALDGGEYVLLSTTDAAEGTEFAPVLEE
jgi:hypothetical protein